MLQNKENLSYNLPLKEKRRYSEESSLDQLNKELDENSKVVFFNWVS